MGKYTGSQCIICQNLFQDSDDIVVCPDCGTPYHRSCWGSVNHCINTPLHAVGGSWQSQQEETRRRLGGKVCPSCQFVNLPEVQNCAACGTSLTPPEEEQESSTRVRIQMPDGQSIDFDAADPCCGLSPEEPVEKERLGDVANFVKTNTLYYIPLFRRFRDTGRKTSLNFTCILFPHLYFAYRKMWLMAILSIFINILCSLPSAFLNLLTTLTSKEYIEMLQSAYGAESVHMFDGLTAFLQLNEDLFQNLSVPLYLINLGIKLLFCLFGNYLYFRFVLKSVGKIRRISPSAKMQKALLQSEGGTSFWNVLGCIGLYFAVSLVIYTVMAVAFM